MWTFRMADYGMNKQEDIFIIIFWDVQLKPLTAKFNGKKWDLNSLNSLETEEASLQTLYQLFTKANNEQHWIHFFFVLFQKFPCMKPNETEGSCVEYKQTYRLACRWWRVAKMWMCQYGPLFFILWITTKITLLKYTLYSAKSVWWVSSWGWRE